MLCATRAIAANLYWFIVEPFQNFTWACISLYKIIFCWGKSCVLQKTILQHRLILRVWTSLNVPAQLCWFPDQHAKATSQNCAALGSIWQCQMIYWKVYNLNWWIHLLVAVGWTRWSAKGPSKRKERGGRTERWRACCMLFVFFMILKLLILMLYEFMLWKCAFTTLKTSCPCLTGVIWYV